MKRIRPQDEKIFEGFFRLMKWESFYHFFPLIYSLDQTTTRVYWEWDRYAPKTVIGYPGARTITVWAEDDLLFPSLEVSSHMVWIALEKHPHYQNQIYDVNFVYDLTKPFPKSFRENAKRFERDNSPVWREAKPNEALEVVEEWYSKRKEGEFHDFGYTLYLSKYFEDFELNGRIVEIKGEPVGFSLWGELNRKTAVHLIAKDKGLPYLQDYLRFKTYEEMRDRGYLFVNDGGAPTEGIRVYKLKLRPYLIYPIYSWVEVEHE